MPILPVLDLMHGKIVHGKGGQRKVYRPIVSTLVAGAEPIAIARALEAHFGFREFYLADLDAIEGGPPAVPTYEQLQSEGYRLWVDAGMRNAASVAFEALLQTNVAGIIAGLESVDGPQGLEEIVRVAGNERIVFSLDLRAGQPIAGSDGWQTVDPWQIAEYAITTLDVRRLIVLDLARVGSGAGTGTEALCTRLKQTFPTIELTAGGGVASAEDVRRLYACGVDYVLAASALHNGRLKEGMRDEG